MAKGISSWLIVVLLTSLVVISIAFYYFFSKGSINFSNPKTKNISLTGVIKLGGLISPRRDYCVDGEYIDSLDGKPLIDNEYSLLIKSLPSTNFSRLDLYTNLNRVATLTGVIVKGQNCSVKNSCSCDDYLDASSITVDIDKSLEYWPTLPSYEGIVTCLTSTENSCSPILTISSGRKYQLVDPAGFFGVFENGKKVKVWASFDGTDTQVEGQTVDGTLYVAKSAGP